MQNRATNRYFNFTRKERNGTIFLLILILLMTAIPFIYPLLFREKIISVNSFQNELAALKQKQQQDSRKNYQKNYEEHDHPGYYKSSEKKFYTNEIKAELFYFDPNTISTDGWKKLGLKEKTINTIQHFLSKGGRFREPADIKKIWGLHEDEAKRLLPFVQIAETVSAHEPLTSNPSVNKYGSKKSLEKIDLNLADTNALTRLPGIGTKLSARIINFRDKLGGFYSVDQVAETFGLPDSVFQKIKPLLSLNEKKLKQVNINTASLEELKQHPYIRYKLANLIIQYRNQHGNFSDISGLKKIMTVDEALYNKLSPYLSIE